MPNLTVSKKDELFIAVCQVRSHTFLMLGVVKEGQPTLIARVGKVFLNDPTVDSSWIGLCGKFFTKKGIDSHLLDEGISRSERHNVKFNYHAHAINFKQMKEFLALLAIIDKKRFENLELSQKVDAYNKVNANSPIEKICAYIPTSESNDSVEFVYKPLIDHELVLKNDDTTDQIAEKAQTINLLNTCRHTAISIMEKILGFLPDVSKWYLWPPKYVGSYVKGLIDGNTFYIFPSPPMAFPNLSDLQSLQLQKIYKRMENVLKSHPDSPETKAKFNALKDTYNAISGTNNLSASQLLEIITQFHQKNESALNAKRNPNALSKLLNLESSTESMFKEMSKSLKKKVDVVPEADSANDMATGPR